VYDHAVFSMYSLSFMALLFIVADLLAAANFDATAACLVVLVPPVHMYSQLKNTYRLGVFGALWRTAALLVVAGIVFMLFLASIIAILLH
jgi:apolipoprotein N-acyltransferase